MDDSSDSEGPFQLYDQFQVIPSLRSNGPDRSDNSEEENTPPLEQTKKRKRGPDVQYILWRRFPDVQSFSRYWRDECASYRSKNSHSNETGAVSTW